MEYLYYLVGFVALILAYFKVAETYQIVDKPNHRSSHSKTTIRGGGIIFPLGFLFYFIANGFTYPFFVIGLFIISVISFIDDIKPLPNSLRLTTHLSAVSLLFNQVELFTFSVWILLVAYVVVIGAINAYNFMDGINGITGAYSLLIILTLWFVNISESFIGGDWLSLTAIALITFNYFNFRRNARCFAGDVGSVSLAFIILFFMLLLLVKSGELKYMAFLMIYGLDSISTILFRLIRRENIFEAHRSHFYQYLVSTKRWPHLRVSILYAVIQLLVNVVVLNIDLSGIQLMAFFLCAGLIFVSLRYIIEGKDIIARKSVLDI